MAQAVLPIPHLSREERRALDCVLARNTRAMADLRRHPLAG